MSYKNEILTKLVLTFCAFTLGICATIIGIGLAVESEIQEALTVNTKPLPTFSSGSK